MISTYLKTHIIYVVVIAALLIGGRLWLSEHDARVIADLTVKQDQTTVQGLQVSIAQLKNAIADNDAKASVNIAALQHALTVVKTPAQIVSAIPSLTDVPLNTRIAPDNPNQVAVDALPFYQALNECKQDAVALGACRADLAAEQVIATKQTSELAAKDDEIKAVTAKPKFWARVKSHGWWASGVMLAIEGLRVYLTGKP